MCRQTKSYINDHWKMSFELLRSPKGLNNLELLPSYPVVGRRVKWCKRLRCAVGTEAFAWTWTLSVFMCKVYQVQTVIV